MTNDLTRPPVEPNIDVMVSKWEKFKNKRIKRKIRRPFIITLVCLLFCFATYIKYSESYPRSVESIFNKYYQIYDINSDQKSNHIQAIRFYKEKKFEKAIELFKEVSTIDDFKTPSKFYLATSYLQCNKTENAIKIYKSIIESEDNHYYDDACWYLGLSYLKTYNIEEARKLFKELVNIKSVYRKESFEILRFLNKLN